MNLKTKRKVLCILFAALMVAGCCMFTGSLLVKSTLCSQRYMQMNFSKSYVEQGSKENVENEFEVLAAQSNIPVRVFETAGQLDGSDTASAVERLFQNHDASLYNQARIELFEDLCKEYLDGNNIKYSDEQIHQTAVRATEIFANSYGFQNTREVTDFINNVNNSYSKYASSGLLLVAVSAAAIFILFSDKMNGISAILTGFTSAGLTFVFIAVGSLIAGAGKNPALYPETYARAVTSSVRGLFIILLLFGIILSAASFAASAAISNNQKRKSGR